ncbi:unnamed protein product [Scytosiphon promiscuus]
MSVAANESSFLFDSCVLRICPATTVRRSLIVGSVASSRQPAASKKSAKAAAKAGPVKRKKKAKKDPNKPKGAMSAFMQFSQQERPVVKAENPDMKITEMSKVLGARWREMDDNDKAPFQKKADKDKARYQKEMEKYKAKKAAEPSSEEEESEEESD